MAVMMVLIYQNQAGFDKNNFILGFLGTPEFTDALEANHFTAIQEVRYSCP